MEPTPRTDGSPRRSPLSDSELPADGLRGTSERRPAGNSSSSSSCSGSSSNSSGSSSSSR
eukprot:14360529-Heterocapsa_arctica.AAC.1